MLSRPICQRQTAHRVRANLRAALVVAAATTRTLGVDNLLEAAQVESRLAAGATALRVEADFVTCSQ